MSLEHQMAGKKGTCDEAVLESVKVGDQVSYVNESGEGVEAKVKSISGETATLEVILKDGGVVTKSGVKYRSSTPEKKDGAVAPTVEVASKSRGKKGGRRGKAKAAAKFSADGRPLDSNGNAVARDIVAFHDSAIMFESDGEPYWHV